MGLKSHCSTDERSIIILKNERMRIDGQCIGSELIESTKNYHSNRSTYDDNKKAGLF